MENQRRAKTSGAKVTLYAHGDDPVLPDTPGPLQFIGRSNRDEDPALVQVSWTKVMGQPSGQFLITVKARDRDTALRRIVDDDYVDISFLQGDREYHHCRGLVDTVREQTNVQGGATSRNYIIRGRDHGKVWQQTNVYFNRFIGENIGGSALLRVFAGQADNVFGDVSKTTFAFLQQFLRDSENQNQGVFWTLPPGLPGQLGGVRFVDSVEFLDSNGGYANGVGYTNQPPRVSFNAAFLDPTGNNLWNLAQQWSDPGFCELYTEIVRKSTKAIPGPNETLSTEDSAMAIILRDRPFPYGPDPKNDSGWFRLPMLEIEPQDIASGVDIGRGGEERFNAFFIRGKAFAEYAGGNVDLVAPILDKESIKKHGFRRYDSQSQYVPDPMSSWTNFLNFKRYQVRDWFCLNPYFLNGNIQLARGFPELRIGMRLRIKSPQGAKLDQTYYVEGIQHTWSLTAGMKTHVQVTRGWIGTDDELLDALITARKRFTLIDGVPRAITELAGDGSFDPGGVA